MRNVFKILTVLALMTASACERLIVDWAPVNVYIQATDNDGNSIISDDMPGMSLTFKGEIYTVQPATKAYLARMEGLVAEKNAEGVFQLRFGEIDGSADMDEDLVLRWPDGSTDVKRIRIYEAPSDVHAVVPSLTLPVGESMNITIDYPEDSWYPVSMGLSSQYLPDGLTGAAAKEIVVSTMGVLYTGESDATEESASLKEKLQTATKPNGEHVFDPIVAYSFMLFILLYFPCIAALAAIRREAGTKWMVFEIFYTTAVAWIVSFIFYQVVAILI